MKIECQKCGYEWDTSSSMDRVTCPSCGYKTPRNETGEKTPQKPPKSSENRTTPHSAQTQENKRKEEVRILNKKIAGVIALIIVVAVGAYAGNMYFGGEPTGSGGGGETPAEGAGTATISLSEVGGNAGTAMAAVAENSGIENIYVCESGSYNLNNNIGENINNGLLGTITSSTGDNTVQIDYNTNFDLIVQVKGENHGATGTEMAYVAKENLKVETRATGDISWPAENIADGNETVFEGPIGSGDDAYIRVNATNSTMQDLSLSADQSMTIYVNYWLYR